MLIFFGSFLTGHTWKEYKQSSCKKQLITICLGLKPSPTGLIVLQVTNPSHYQLSYRSLLTIRKISKDYEQILKDDKILVSILTHRCQCPHVIKKRGGFRGGATHIHKRKLSSEPHVKKGYKWGNHLFHTPGLSLFYPLLPLPG